MITFTVLLRGLFELLELESKLSSSEYKQFLGFLVCMGVFVLLFKRAEILEKDRRDIKEKRICISSCCRAWLSYICDKRKKLKQVDLLLKLLLLSQI